MPSILTAPALALVLASASTGTGTWQTLEMEVAGESLTAWLNGVRLTRAIGIAERRGAIGIQSEAGALEFRRVEILPLGARRS